MSRTDPYTPRFGRWLGAATGLVGAVMLALTIYVFLEARLLGGLLAAIAAAATCNLAVRQFAGARRLAVALGNLARGPDTRVVATVLMYDPKPTPWIWPRDPSMLVVTSDRQFVWVRGRLLSAARVERLGPDDISVEPMTDPRRHVEKTRFCLNVRGTNHYVDGYPLAQVISARAMI